MRVENNKPNSSLVTQQNKKDQAVSVTQQTKKDIATSVTQQTNKDIRLTQENNKTLLLFHVRDTSREDHCNAPVCDEHNT